MPRPRAQKEQFAAKPVIPKFRSREEESQFWETHSPLDYVGWQEAKQLRVARPLSHVLGVRLDAMTIDRLAEIGERMGIGPSTLARIWIMERLSEMDKDSRSSAGTKDLAQTDVPPLTQAS